MVGEIIVALQKFFYELLEREIQVIAVIPSEAGWTAEVEVIVEDDYMRRRGRKDIIAQYEASVSRELTITSYARKGLRERGSLE